MKKMQFDINKFAEGFKNTIDLLLSEKPFHFFANLHLYSLAVLPTLK